MAKLGFVGLGVMGGAVAGRLLAAGHEVHGWNRTREKAAALLDQGLLLGDSPRAVAEGEEGILSGLGQSKVWVDMTTAAPAVSRELAERVRETGADMVDAPVSGSVSTLEEGKLSIMVGGAAETFERVKPILLDIGPKATHVGDNGQALLLKIAINLSLHVQMVAFSEGLLLAEKDGIDREVALDVMLGSVIASPMLKYRGPFVLEMPDEAWFDVNMMQKDMLLALEAGRQLDVPMPTTAIANELLTAARGMGLEHNDFAVVYEVLAELAGLRKVER